MFSEFGAPIIEGFDNNNTEYEACPNCYTDSDTGTIMKPINDSCETDIDEEEIILIRRNKKSSTITIIITIILYQQRQHKMTLKKMMKKEAQVQMKPICLKACST